MSGDGWGSSFAPISKAEAQERWSDPWEIHNGSEHSFPLEGEKLQPKHYQNEFFNGPVVIKKERSNVPPTHDPYTNPNAELYYSCNCGAILDPGTKRFAELNNCASNAGWKIRFTDSGYVPYCVECGKGVD